MPTAGGQIAEHRSASKRALVALAGLVALAAAPPGAEARELRIEAGDGGELALTARDVPIAEVLAAVSTEGGFALDVAGAEGRRRPAANLVLPMSPLDDVLRELLRGRNHAIVYDDGGAPSRVLLLAPSDPRRVGRPPPRKRPPPGKRRSPPRQGPIVVVR